MTISVTQQIESRTFLQAVQRLLLAVGDSVGIGTLASPHSRTMKAMQAANDALEACYMAARWPWRVVHYEITLVAQQMWYTLPTDFALAHSGPRRNAVMLELPFVPLAELYELHPEIRAVPPGTSVSTTTVIEHAGASYFGMPAGYTIAGGSVGLFPVPDADAVSEAPTWLMTYYKLPAEMVGDSDVLDLPKYLWMAHHRIALGLLQQSLEFADGQATYFEGMNQLRNQIAMQGLMDTRNEYTVGGLNYNE